jgi:hypothetical protein
MYVCMYVSYLAMLIDQVRQKLIVTHLVKKYPLLTEPGLSLLSSQETTINPYFLPDERRPHLPTLFP